MSKYDTNQPIEGTVTDGWNEEVRVNPIPPAEPARKAYEVPIPAGHIALMAAEFDQSA